MEDEIAKTDNSESKLLAQLEQLTRVDRPSVIALGINTDGFKAAKRQLVKDGIDNDIIIRAANPPAGAEAGILVANVKSPDRYIELLEKLDIAAKPLDTIEREFSREGLRKDSARLNRQSAIVITHADANVLSGKNPQLQRSFGTNNRLEVF